jgi:hypothetical protein
MPVYLCCRGNATPLVLDKPGLFVLEDAQGRTWLCAPTPLTPRRRGPDGDTLAVLRGAVQRLEGLAAKQGFPPDESEAQLVLAGCPEELRTLLPPPGARGCRPPR